MNEINAQQRLREANAFKADAEKILLVKSAEAESESKHMTGVGIARQRKGKKIISMFHISKDMTKDVTKDITYH